MKITNCKFLRSFRINAIVVYPFVFYCDLKPSEDILTHEQVHFDQIKRIGVLKFYFLYLWQYFNGRKKRLNYFAAYRNISFEKEANERSGQGTCTKPKYLP